MPVKARDAKGRFLAAAEAPKPWTILATNRIALGAEMRSVNRRKGLVTATREANQVRFASREEAEAHLAKLDWNKRWRFTVAKL